MLLQAVKVGGLKKNSATQQTTHVSGPGLSLRRWNHSQSLMDCNFAALLPTETHRTSLERSNILLKYTFNS